MTSVILALGLLLVPQTPAPAPPVVGTGLISGVVTSSSGNRPIANVTIRAVHWTGGLGRQFGGRTDAQGRFTLKDLPAGSYEIQAQTDGHVSLRYGQRVLTDAPKRIELIEAQQFTDADIVLPKFTAIEGQLLDEFGDPVPGVLVMPTQVSFVAGKTRLTPAPGANQSGIMPTDDRGVFRIFGLAPGEYYLTATAGPFAPNNPPGFAVTFYPGTKNPQDAKAVKLEAGRDTRGLSFAMTPAPMSTVSGIVTDADGKPIARGSIMLFGLSGGDIRAFMSGNIPSGPDGQFTFRNVAPGSYVVQAYGRPAPGGGNLGRSPFGSVVFDVSGDRDDLKLVVKGARFTGRIIFEGSAPQPPVDRVLPILVPVEFVTSPAGGGPPAYTVNPDWTFEVLNMSGQRMMRPVIGTPGWILKSVTLGGKDVTDSAIDFRDGDVSGAEVTLTSNIGSIKGTVTDANGPATDAAIFAFADDTSKWVFPSRFMGAGRVNPKGEFTIPGLPAGTYLVAVAPAGLVPQSADPALLENLRKTAVRVNVLEGATASVTLTIK